MTPTLGLALCLACASPRADNPANQLVVFVRATDSAVDRRFRAETLPSIRELAGAQGLDFKVHEVTNRAPSDVRITPLLVFQNHRGRSIYQGRYQDLSRLANFLRTAVWVPQAAIPLVRENVLVLRRGRVTIACRTKITPLTGTLPAEFDVDGFNAQASIAIDAAWADFDRHPEVSTARSDRTFYLDFYPHRSAAGTPFVSTAIYSQFNCEIPVYLSPEPASGGRESWGEAFTAAATDLRVQLDAVLASPETGDGFDPIPASVAAATWPELGLALPMAPKNSQVTVSRLELAQNWVLDAARPGDPPRLQFQFAPPLESYAGECTQLSCNLRFDPNLKLSGLRGAVTVDVTSVTMGDPYLDESLQASDVLNATKHPSARFDIDRVSAHEQELEFGAPLSAQLHGRFQLKGITLPLTANLTLQAIVDAGGAPHLLADGSFRIRLAEHFGIAGPDGPEPARDTLLFAVHLSFSPSPQD